LVAEKAARYLAEGRLTVHHADGQTVRASCRGQREYGLGFDGGSWACSCPARRECAHLVALRLVAVAKVAPTDQDSIP
jgi:uncharacterized Zn finger protein